MKKEKRKRILPEEAVLLLKEKSRGDEKSFNNILAHCKKVSEIALRIANNAKKKSELDIELIENSALLHDIGRYECPPKTPSSIRHGVVGAEILRIEGDMTDKKEEFEQYARIAETHLGGGITKKDIEKKNLPLPKKDFLPQTKEEKIVSAADKLAEGSKEITLEQALYRWKKEFGKEVAERVRKMHDEVKNM